MNTRYCATCRREHPVLLCDVCLEPLAKSHLLVRLCAACRLTLKAAHLEVPESVFGQIYPPEGQSSVSVDTGRQSDRIVSVEASGSYVYQLVDGPGDGRVLYVGRSGRIWARLAEHLRNPVKREQVSWIRLLRMNSHEHAVETELRLIRELQPSWNQLGVRQN